MDDWKTHLKQLDKYKYPFLVILIGAALMLLPARSEDAGHTNTLETALEEVLADTTGVGMIRILVSDNGAVAVCEGADSAAVRLDILRAIGSYTGLGSEKITILKMANHRGR